MKYIGITGHRGSGKSSVSYLLGNTMDMILRNYTEEEIKQQFTEWCTIFKKNKTAIFDCTMNNVYFDSFGELPKHFVALLLSIDMSVLDNEYMKDNMYVNMKDFNLYSYEDSFKIINSEDILNNTSKKWKDCYISLRDFTKCFSIDIMQKLFGTNVWLKSIIVNNKKWPLQEDVWIIYIDAKTKDEIQYIKDNDGVLIKTIRPSHKKKHKGIIDVEDENVKFVINTEGELVDLFEQIYEISNKILKNY